jgi:translocation and assembly module TamB
LVEPELIAAENARGEWVKVPELPPSKPGDFQVEVREVEVVNGKVTAIPRSPASIPGVAVRVDGLNLTATINSAKQQLTLRGDGNSALGKLAVTGNSDLRSQKTELEVYGKDLIPQEIDRIVNIPAVEFSDGRVDGRVRVSVLPNRNPDFSGRVVLRNVTTKIDGVPQLLRQGNGAVDFDSRRARFENVSTSFDRLPGTINGEIDFTNGYALRGDLLETDINIALQTLGVKVPVPITGKASGTVALTGKLDMPIVAGEVRSREAVTVDKVVLTGLQGKFSLAEHQLNLTEFTATPTVGGNLRAAGKIHLDENPDIAIDWQGDRLSAANILSLYDNTELPINLGEVNVAGKITGSADNLNINIGLNAPQATYPLQANLTLNPTGEWQLNSARAKIANGEIQATGKLINKDFQLTLETKNIDPSKLSIILKSTNPSQLNSANNVNPDSRESLSGKFYLSGNLDLANLDNIRGTGTAIYTNNLGTVKADRLTLVGGNWQGDISLLGMDLREYLPTELRNSAGKITGNFRVAGNTQAKKIEDLNIIGNSRFTLAGGTIEGTNIRISGGKWQGNFRTDNLATNAFIPNSKGRLNGEFLVAGNFANLTNSPQAVPNPQPGDNPNSGSTNAPPPSPILSQISLQGKASLLTDRGTIVANRLVLNSGEWNGDFQAVNANLRQLFPQGRGTFDGQFQARGNLARSSLQDLLVAGNGRWRLDGAAVDIRDARLDRGRWQARFGVNRLPLGRMGFEIPSPWREAALTGNVGLAGDINNRQVLALQGSGDADLVWDDRSQVSMRNFRVNNGSWQGDLGVRDLAVARFGGARTPLADGRISWQGNAAGDFRDVSANGLSDRTIDSLVLSGSGILALAGNSRLGINNLRVSNGRWQSELVGERLPLNRLGDGIPAALRNGLLSARLAAAGSLRDFRASSVRVGGDGEFISGNDRLSFRDLRLADNRFDGSFSTSSLALSRLGSSIPVGLRSSVLVARGRVAGNLADRDLRQLRFAGEGDLAFGSSGRLAFRNVSIAAGGWQGDITANNVPLGALGNDIPAGLRSSVLAARGRVSGRLGDSNFRQLRLAGEADLGLAGNRRIELRNVSIAAGGWQGDITANNVPLSGLGNSIPVGWRSSILSTRARVSGRLGDNNFRQLRLAGEADLALTGNNRIELRNVSIAAGGWQGDITANNVPLSGLGNSIPAALRSSVLTTRARVAGRVGDNNWQNWRLAGDGDLAFGNDSRLAVRNIRANNGNWEGDIAADRLDVSRFAGSLGNNVPLALTRGILTARVSGKGNLQTLSSRNNNLRGWQLSGSGELKSSDGSQLTARDFRLNQVGDWQGSLTSLRFPLSSLRLTNVPKPITAAILTAEITASGNVNDRTQRRLQISGNTDFTLPNGGKIGARNLNIANGRWQGDFNIFKLAVSSLGSPAIPAPWRSAIVSWQGSGSGNLANPNDIGSLELTGNWQATLNNTPTNILLSGQNWQLKNRRFQGTAIVNNLPIEKVATWFPNPSFTSLNARGIVTGNWQISGALNNRNQPIDVAIDGNQQILGLQVANRTFDQEMKGTVRLTNNNGVNLALAGTNDRLNLTLDRQLQPRAFDIKNNELVAAGTIASKTITLNLNQLPFAFARQYLPANTPLKNYHLDGQLSGEISFNSANNTVSSRNLIVDNFRFDEITGDRFIAAFEYRHNKIKIDRADMILGNRQYGINGNFQTTARGIVGTGNIVAKNGDLVELRNRLKIFSIEDLFNPFGNRNYGRASAIPTIRSSETNPNNVEQQLRRLAEIQAWQNTQVNRNSNNFIPDLRNIKGNISGRIGFKFDGKKAADIDFDIAGDNWQIDNYQLDRLAIKGAIKKTSVNFDKLFFTSVGTTFEIERAKIDENGPEGRIKVKSLPSYLIGKAIYLPVVIDGTIDIDAQISGAWLNPMIDGEISLKNCSIQATSVPFIRGRFNYENARLRTDITADFVLPASEDAIKPINIAASVPLPLPFNQISPSNNAIKIDVNIRDSGLKILDIISQQQLAWNSGTGNVKLEISGVVENNSYLAKTITKGTIKIDNGTLGGVSLPEPIVNVNAAVDFNFDRVIIRKFTGNLSRGTLAAAGSLPIDSLRQPLAKNTENPTPTTPQSPPCPAATNQETIALTATGLQLNLKDRYIGSVDGRLAIGGSFRNPRITCHNDRSSEILLTNGILTLPENNTAENRSTPAANNNGNASNTPLEIDNLRVVLGNNVRTIKPPLLDFTTRGILDVSGNLESPRLQGKIDISGGEVNLFTTRFRLAGGYNHTAEFFPEFGVEPIVNLRLFTKTLETTRRRTVIGNEILDSRDVFTTNQGAVQTIQVQAAINNLPASQITTRLELTSTPARSQSELVLLLGGSSGLVQAFGQPQGDIGLGLANVAGSALLSNVQGVIGETLGLSDFRLFPTLTSESNSRTSALGLAAEVGMELSPQLSTSIFKVLTTNERPQYSLRYRIDDRTSIRGSTNLFGENRAIIEFEERF